MGATNPIRPDETGDEKHRLVVHIPISLRDALQRAAVEKSLGRPRITTVSKLVRDLLEREFGDDDGMRRYAAPRRRARSTGCSPLSPVDSNATTQQDADAPPMPEAVGW